MGGTVFLMICGNSFLWQQQLPVMALLQQPEAG
jgi:hypothetical protein